MAKRKSAPRPTPAKLPRRCELCHRDKPLTEHHLLPRAIHRRKRFVARYGKAELQTRKLLICRLCHDGIHDLIPSEKELAEQYNTKELLLAHEGLRRHVEWVKKQK